MGSASYFNGDMAELPENPQFSGGPDPHPHWHALERAVGAAWHETGHIVAGAIHAAPALFYVIADLAMLAIVALVVYRAVRRRSGRLVEH